MSADQPLSPLRRDESFKRPPLQRLHMLLPSLACLGQRASSVSSQDASPTRFRPRRPSCLSSSSPCWSGPFLLLCQVYLQRSAEPWCFSGASWLGRRLRGYRDASVKRTASIPGYAGQSDAVGCSTRGTRQRWRKVDISLLHQGPRPPRPRWVVVVQTQSSWQCLAQVVQERLQSCTIEPGRGISRSEPIPKPYGVAFALPKESLFNAVGACWGSCNPEWFSNGKPDVRQVRCCSIMACQSRAW